MIVTLTKEYEIYKPLLMRWIAEREEEAVACSGSE